MCACEGRGGCHWGHDLLCGLSHDADAVQNQGALARGTQSTRPVGGGGWEDEGGRAGGDEELCSAGPTAQTTTGWSSTGKAASGGRGAASTEAPEQAVAR